MNLIRVLDIAGCQPHRMHQTIIFNMTVNLRGGPGNNLEMDLVNEFMNRDFIGKYITYSLLP